MVDLLVTFASYHGHDPREAREYSVRDLELLMHLAPIFDQYRHGGFYG